MGSSRNLPPPQGEGRLHDEPKERLRRRLLDLPQKPTIRALSKAKFVEPKTYSPLPPREQAGSKITLTPSRHKIHSEKETSFHYIM